MKMNGKKLIGVLLAVVTATACLSCGKKTQTSAGVNGSIDVTYYEGGTGKVWIEKIAADFEAETGVKVNLTPDPMATENALTLLESGRNLPDLMFILYTNWTKYVQNGWLAEMDDLYDGTFSASYEVNGKTNTISSLYGTEGTTVFSDSGKTLFRGKKRLRTERLAALRKCLSEIRGKFVGKRRNRFDAFQIIRIVVIFIMQPNAAIHRYGKNQTFSL